MNIYLRLLTVAFVWGGTFIATRAAAQYLAPFAGAFLRFLFASAGLLALMLLQQKPWPRPGRRMLLHLTGMALTGIIAYNYFFFSALKILPASRASLLVALNPVMVLFAAALFFGETLRWVKVLGGLLALFGAVVVISRGDLGHIFDHFGPGEALALGCPATWAVYTLLSRHASGDGFTPLVTTTYVCLFGTLGLFPLALLDGLPLWALPARIWGALAYLGLLGTVLGFVWYAEGIRTIGATRTAIFNNLVPVFGVLLSVLLLGETVSWVVVGGGLFVVLGVAVINFL
ncbi:MAG: DMT family transporter [Saprospirales bacterium]|nr:DMT family transporter [Saprospirales bacterium]MBK8923851.1 DMT family transporter [Saprospirales bacterium]